MTGQFVPPTLNEIMEQFQSLLPAEEIAQMQHDMDCCDDAEDTEELMVAEEPNRIYHAHQMILHADTRPLSEQIADPNGGERGYRRHYQEEEKDHYYNVGKTENPYIFKYKEVPMEELSENFKITKQQVYNIGYCFHPCDENGRPLVPRQKGVQYVVVYDLVREALKSYKEQLQAGKKCIIDAHLVSDNVRYVVESVKQEYGLSVSKEGKVTLKKERKSQSSTTTVKVSKGEINRNFKYGLQAYTRQQLGFDITITVRTASLYNILTSFKTLFPNAIYNDIVMSGTNSYYYGLTPNSVCEDMWNNPKLAKVKKKKPTKKEKK